MKTLKAITHCYTQDDIPCNKVIGIFRTRDQLNLALTDIKESEAYKNIKIKKDVYEKSCDNYFLEYENGDWFYSSDFEVNKLYL